MQPERPTDRSRRSSRFPSSEQRLLSFDGAGDEHRDDERDEVLYVLEGSGTVTVGGESRELEPGTGVFVARGTAWQVESADGLKLLSVLVEEPLPASASHAVIASGERGTATAGREFTLLAHPENGCESVTQFRGYIPVGRAPDHFHRYDEVVYVLEGQGAFHVDGESAPLRAGSCIHLPARLVHCLENQRPRRDAGARSLPAGGLAGRGLLPRRLGGRRPARLLMPHIERTAHVGWDGNLARGAGTIDAATGAFARLAVLASVAGRRARAARRAPRSCSRPRTAAASRCRSPVSSTERGHSAGPARHRRSRS